jgi:hypothetical protein
MPSRNDQEFMAQSETFVAEVPSARTVKPMHTAFALPTFLQFQERHHG